MKAVFIYESLPASFENDVTYRIDDFMSVQAFSGAKD